MGLEIGIAGGRCRRIDHRARFERGAPAVGEGRVPRTRVPNPVDVLGVERVADGVCRLRRQGRGIAGVGVQKTGSGGRRLVAARLIRGLHGVHGVELAVAEIVGGRDIAAVLKLGRFVQGGGFCVLRRLEPRHKVSGRVPVEHRDGRFRRRPIRVGIDRRTGANQVLVIEEGTAERALKKIISEHEVLRQSEQRRLAVVIVAHGETAGVGPRGVAVVLAAVDLHLVFEKAMYQVAGHGRRRQSNIGLRRKGALYRERRVG
jgi:hypothetical protein